MARSGKKHAVKMAIGAAAVGVATSVTAVAVTQPASISATLVDLTALIVVGSSTNPSGAGVEDFFGGMFRNNQTYTGPGRDDIIRVNFFDGPAGIQAAIDQANRENAEGQRNAVLASGWGAANASLLLLRDNPSLGNTVFILDNDVARPDGGFGTRYPLFALIGVNPIPTPSETPASWVVNTGYEYDYNSNAPGYVLNPFSAVNSLAAYLNTRLNQADIELPVKPDGTPLYSCDGADTCALTESGAVLECPDARCAAPAGDRIVAYVTTRDNTTYVTYTARELPLTTLVRSVFGDYIADVSAPLLKWAVDFGYYGGNPIPSDPSAYRPARFVPSIGDIVTALLKLPSVIIETLAAIVSPFLPRQAAPSNTPMMMMRETTEQETGNQETEEVTELSSAGEGTEERTKQETQEFTTDELTTHESTPQQLTTEDQKTEEQKTAELKPEVITTPLMNVLRNSLRAFPGQSFATTGDDHNSKTTDAEPVDSEQNSKPEEGVDLAPVGNPVPNADPNPDGDGDDSSESETDAAA